MVNKILKWGGLAFVVYFVAFRPQSAANLVSTIGSTILSAASGVGEFISAAIT